MLDCFVGGDIDDRKDRFDEIRRADFLMGDRFQFVRLSTLFNERDGKNFTEFAKELRKFSKSKIRRLTGRILCNCAVTLGGDSWLQFLETAFPTVDPQKRKRTVFPGLASRVMMPVFQISHLKGEPV